jgi:SAM-dependent methyltransferase
MRALKPTPLVRKFASQIAATAGAPILDVACGSGRNAIVLAELGCTVVCLDNDLRLIRVQRTELSNTHLKQAFQRLKLQRLDLNKDPWPFAASSVGGIINVHFFLPTLLPLFEKSLMPGSYLLLETVPGCGGNYLQLPKAGEVKFALGRAYDFEFYRERRVGPFDYDAVTVQLLARRVA